MIMKMIISCQIEKGRGPGLTTRLISHSRAHDLHHILVDGWSLSGCHGLVDVQITFLSRHFKELLVAILCFYFPVVFLLSSPSLGERCPAVLLLCCSAVKLQKYYADYKTSTRLPISTNVSK